jgi:hypothetical protein
MTKIWSINAVVNELAKIAASHAELKSFGYGELNSIDSQEQLLVKYAQLWVEPINTQLILGKNSSVDQRRFVLYCYDLIRQDEKNVISTWNQTELILIDVCRLLQYSSGGFRLVNNPILTPMSERFSDNVTGYYCEVVIETAEIVGTCEMPYIDNLNLNGNWLYNGVWIDLDTWRNQ